MKQVTEVLLQKGRRVKYRFQVATLTLSILFPIPELGHMLETPACVVLLLFSMFGSISIAIFKAGSNSLGKTFAYCRSSLTNSCARNKFSHQYAKTVILKSFHFGVHDLPHQSPPWSPSSSSSSSSSFPQRYRNKVYSEFTFSFLFFGLVELVLPTKLRNISVMLIGWSFHGSIRKGKRGYNNQNGWDANDTPKYSAQSLI